MPDSAHDLRKASRQSARALPVSVALLLGLAAALWLAGRFVAVPRGLAALVLGLAAFAVVGEVLNVIYCRCQLRRHGDARPREATRAEHRGD